MEIRTRLSRYWPLLTILLIFSFVFFSSLVTRIVRYDNLVSNTDEADYTQFAYNISHGRLTTSIEATRPEQSIFAYHAFITMPFLVAPYYLFHHPLTLSLWQIFCVLSAFIPLYLMARDLDKNGLAALAVCAAYLLNGNLLINVVWFHETTLVTGFLLWAFYFRYRGWNKAFYLSLIFIMLTKEDLAGLVGAIGFSLFLYKERKVGAIIFGTALIWFFMAILVFIPHFSLGERDPLAYLGFEWSWRYLAAGFNRVAFLRLLKFIGLFAFLPLLVPEYLAMSLATLIFIFLGGVNSYFNNLTGRYVTPLVAIFALATIAALKKQRNPRVRMLYCMALILVAFGQHFFMPTDQDLNPFRKQLKVHYAGFMQGAPEEAQVFRSLVVKYLKGRDHLAVSHYLLLDFAETRFIKLFPNRWEDAEYLVIDLRYPTSYPFGSRTMFEEMLAEISQTGRYQTLYESPSYLVLKRAEKVLK